MNTTEVRASHDILNYFQRFIPQFGDIAKPRMNLSEKYVKLSWTGKFSIFQLKTLLYTAPVLAYPDFNKLFYLATDASTIGFGAMIYQIHNDVARSVAFISQEFNATD
jgi:RNase H-like domain found in reverse transcriptase